MTGTRKGDGSRLILHVNLKHLREQEALTETDYQVSENRQTCEGARILSETVVTNWSLGEELEKHVIAMD